MATINGGTGNDSLTGLAESDSITGNAGNDTLLGLGGSDLIFGGEGNDSLFGGIGNDLLEGGAGNDNIDGGDGIDTLSYLTSNAAIFVSLTSGTAEGGRLQRQYQRDAHQRVVQVAAVAAERVEQLAAAGADLRGDFPHCIARRDLLADQDAQLARDVRDAFETFDTTPLASASIAQVHAAILPGGREVVVKVLRPDIRKQIAGDIALLESIAAIVERALEKEPDRRTSAEAGEREDHNRNHPPDGDLAEEEPRVRAEHAAHAL